jgi:ABC-type transport system involved in cytochrome bd biosynthesis fused ATPase/permease subunit
MATSARAICKAKWPGPPAAALANRPVLLLDEPTGHLDPDTAATVINAVLELAADRSLL